MVGITYMYIDTIFTFCGYVDFVLLIHLYCLLRCLSMTVWTHAVLGIFLYFCICSRSAQLSMFHMERRSGNTIIITIIMMMMMMIVIVVVVVVVISPPRNKPKTNNSPYREAEVKLDYHQTVSSMQDDLFLLFASSSSSSSSSS